MTERHMLFGHLLRVASWRRSVRLGLWYATAMAAVALDYATGPFIQFPIAFLLPVALAAWFDGPFHGLLLAIGLSAIRLGLTMGVWTVPWTAGTALANAAIRVSIFSLLAYLTARVAEHDRTVTREARMLEQLLPICSYCKKIRDQDKSWQPLETYLRIHGDLAFSHSLCPDCAHEHYPDLFEAP
jgi:hypothetical protein